MVGLAPIGTKNEPILVLSPNDAVQFGEQLPGFTIPQALDAIFKQGPATVIVVNTFDSVTNTEQVTLESHTITSGKLKLSAAPIGSVTVFLTDGTTPFAGVAGVDYSIDAFGNFTALSAVAAEGLVLKFSFKTFDSGTVTSAQIIGTNTSGVRTGSKCLELVFGMFGFKPKLLISPVYIELPAVSAEFEVLATKYRGISIPDAPEDTSFVQALALRGFASSPNSFKTNSERVYPVFPYLLAYDADSDSNINVPYSAYMAGVISWTDLNEGYWVSPSNHAIKGVLGTRIPIVSDFTDLNSEANLLNEKGITTVYVAGSTIRTWGNRNASFPLNTNPKSFLCVRRTADVIHESLEQAMLPFIDKPLNQATIDAIRDTGNGFFRTLIGRGACLSGSKCVYSADNTAEELAAGHVIFDLVFMSPTPAERITFKSYLDVNLLTKIV